MLDCDTGGGVYIFLSIGKFGPSNFIKEDGDGWMPDGGGLVGSPFYCFLFFLGANHSVYWKVGMTFYQCDENLSDFFKIMILILIVKCGVKYLACV